MTRQMTFLEFFAGGGMARLGLSPMFECTFSNDYNENKAESYTRNFDHENLTVCAIEDLRADDIPTADLAWASFPCQDLSSAGLRNGLKARRSGAFWAFWSLMSDLGKDDRSPGIIVLENVTGLLTSGRGQDFANLVDTIARQGYKIGGLVMDAADFLPQSRPRLFLIATRNPAPEVCMAAGPSQFHVPQLVRAVEHLPRSARDCWHWWRVPTPPKPNTRLIDFLDDETPETAWRSEADLARLLSQMAPLHRARVDTAVAARTPQIGAVYRRIRQGEQRAEVRYDGLAGCVRTLKGGSSRQLLLYSENGWLRLRPMSVREAARLMGLPETYSLPKGATRGFNLAGDGVCVPVVKWLASELLVPLVSGEIKSAQETGKQRAIS